MCCNGAQMLGIWHCGALEVKATIVMIVGGPQYRVGSHRLYVEIARVLASLGVSVLRFDCRGMGDSDGIFTSFESVEDDIRCAVDTASQANRGGQVVLFGLCDGASAAALYGHLDPRVTGLILLNPWVRTEVGESQARMRHYYGKRLGQAQFWKELLTGRLNILESILSLGTHARKAIGRRSTGGYVDRMALGLRSFRGRVQILLSESDLTAQEFQGLINSSREWRRALIGAGAELVRIGNADHTLSDQTEFRYALDHIAKFVQSTVLPNPRPSPSEALR